MHLAGAPVQTAGAPVHLAGEPRDLASAPVHLAGADNHPSGELADLAESEDRRQRRAAGNNPKGPEE